MSGSLPCDSGGIGRADAEPPACDTVGGTAPGAELKIVRVLLPNSTVFMNPGLGPERRGILKPKVAV